MGLYIRTDTERYPALALRFVLERRTRAGRCAGRDGESSFERRTGLQCSSPNLVTVRVDHSALRGGAGRSGLPVETVRRISCDAERVVIGEDMTDESLFGRPSAEASTIREPSGQAYLRSILSSRV